MAKGNAMTEPHDPSERDTVDGTVESVRYQSDETGYTVCDVEQTNGQMIIAVGTMPYVSVGESVRLFGEFVQHPTYGRQFRVDYFEKILPTEKNDILRYLSSGTIRGIGPKTARKIVDAYGDDTFEVMEKHPEWLSEINGITPKKAREIGECFKERSGVRDIMMFCRDRFAPATALRIYKKWGNGAVDLLKKDPYRLCRDLDGIGFARADALAVSFGISETDEMRLKAGVRYALSVFADRDGHTYVPRDVLAGAAADLLGVDRDATDRAIGSLCDEAEVYHVDLKNAPSHIYLPKYYVAESYVASKLKRIDRAAVPLDARDVGRFIDQLEASDGIRYASLQKQAIYEALSGGVTILTGGPGTGKTTVVRALLSIFNRLEMDCALAAPTGRAAKRMSEATSNEAKTIHRLLEMEYAEGEEPRFLRNEDDLLEYDVVIVDEASMIDVLLMSSLLKALRPGTRLILIGDEDQLPSVGAGNVLHDLIASGKFSTVRLTEIFRQAQGSKIILNAHAIRSGNHPDLASRDSDFFFISADGEDGLADYVANLCKNRLPAKYHVDPFLDIQVIAPSKKGALGTANLNTVLQQYLNPPAEFKAEFKRGSTVFREGDRVMQVHNDYQLEWNRDNREHGFGVFNGDIGILETVNLGEQLLCIRFDDKTVLYDLTQADEIELAYAVTVHKSQGSEYPIVILPLSQSVPPMLRTRNLLYTAVTRAKNIVVCVGRRDVVFEMVDRNQQKERNTGLCKLLANPDD